MDLERGAALDMFVQDARRAFGADLVSVALFGSAAEDRARPVSDVNVAVVLRRLDGRACEAFRESLALARASGGVDAMFLLESEVPHAAALFPVKFGEIARRHRVLYGADAFGGASASRESRIRALRRAALDLAIRIRRRRIETPPDGAAAVLRELRGGFAAMAAEREDLGAQARGTGATPLDRTASALLGPRGAQALDAMRAARKGDVLDSAHAATALETLGELAEGIRVEAEAHSP